MESLNSTLAASIVAQNQANIALNQSQYQWEMAIANYTQAIKHQSDALSRAQQTIADCKAQVDGATERWNNESIACAPRTCVQALGRLCAAARRSSAGDCLVCAGLHQQQLMQANCGTKTIDIYCSVL